MEIILYATYVISSVLLIAVIMPLVKSSHWVFRAFEYPRFQKFILACVSLAAWVVVIKNNSDNLFHWSFSTLVLLATIYLAYKIWPYTPISRKEMFSIKPGDVNNQITIFTANVYQFNTRYPDFLQQIQQYNADIIFLLETNADWERNMDSLKQSHPHTMLIPLNNTYGMLFYSRLPLVEGFIRFLVDDEVPSIEAVVQLRSGQKIKIYGLHPKPPMPSESKTTDAKDKELMKVAEKANKEQLPVIVMGDLNDVAWSKVTELFRKTSHLLDPRRGRGFYSTFSAKNWLVRFPLDYIFCSTHFGLVHMCRCKSIGSDHFPMFSHFQFEESFARKQKKPRADAEEKEEAREKRNAQVPEASMHAK